MNRLASSTAWRSPARLIAVVAASIIGCGHDSSGVPVQGHVSYEGQPIVNGALMFFPPQGSPIPAVTDAAGDYAVKLAPSEYTVTVNVSVQLPAGWKEGDPVPRQKIVLPAEYTTRVKSVLKATVAANGSQPIDFVLPVGLAARGR
jgi:hypothetical protein